MEVWEKVLVDTKTYPASVHGQIGCIECHNGVQSPDKDIAHTNLISRPSEDAEKTCGSCHPNITAMQPHNLHNNLEGYWTVLEERGANRNNPAMQQAFNNHCASCHTSCGDCHIAQPASVGGGLISGHNYNRTPSLTRNCTACHGSRVGNEYLGKHEGLMADVHFRQGRMTCIACHTGDQMHGALPNCQECHTGPDTPSAELMPPDHRYAGPQQPSCESCHVTVTTGQDGLQMHTQHGADLQCQVCHSVAYTSCDGCHVAVSETSGNPYFATEGSYLNFLIGLNPNPTFERPYKYVTVRHVPVAPTSFEYYGDNMLPTFDNLSTWRYTTPHNIQRITPQNSSCGACHENEEIFLTWDKVKPEELRANLDVIVREVPPSVIELLQRKLFTVPEATTPQEETISEP